MTKKPTKKPKAAARQETPKRKGPGRPTDWKPEIVPQSQKLAARGWTREEIADFLGITSRTFRRWCISHPELDAALSIPEDKANARVIHSLYKQATGYEREEEDIRIVNGEIVRIKIKKFYPPSTSAAIFWAKAKAGLRDDMPIDPSGPLDPNPGDEAPTEQEPPKQVARRILYLINKGDQEENAA